MRLALVAAFVPVVLSAQLPELAPGSRLRVVTLEGRAFKGDLVAQSPDALQIREENGACTQVPANIIAKVHKSAGQTSRAGARKGAKLGAWLGFVLTFAYVFVMNAGSEEQLGATAALEGQPVGTQLLMGSILGAVAGALAAGAIGWIQQAEEWHQVYPIPVRLTQGAPRDG